MYGLTWWHCVFFFNEERWEYAISQVCNTGCLSSHCAHFSVICRHPLYVEFHFHPGHLYARPPKVPQDCFLWNWVTPFYSLVKIVYHFYRTSFLQRRSLHPFKWLTVSPLTDLVTFQLKYVQHIKTIFNIKLSMCST